MRSNEKFSDVGVVELKCYPSICTAAPVLTCEVCSVSGQMEEGWVGGRGEGWKVRVALSGLSPAAVHCSGLPAWRLAQLGLVGSMPPQ